MEREIERNLVNGNFKEVDRLLENVPINDTLIEIGYRTENLIVYTYITYRITEAKPIERVFWHLLADSILEHCFNFIEGGYLSALYHIRKAEEIEPENPRVLEALLYIYGLPEQLIDETEAYSIANRLLQIEPDNKSASNTIEEMRKEK